jgi:hypothetical protein
VKFPKQHETGAAEACRGGRRSGQRRQRWLGAEVSAARVVGGRCWCRSGQVSKWREAGNCRCGLKVGVATCASRAALVGGVSASAGGTIDLRGEQVSRRRR